MAIRLSTAAVNAKCNAAVDLLDAGPGAGTIKIYSGTQPATANDSASGTLLATFTLADPAFSAAAAGVATLSGVPLGTTGASAGTAGWFRAADSTGATVFDGAITVTGGGGQLELNTTTISVGVAVEITGGSYTQPAA
jgi:hypothetical protein